jgi:hypothetical protein
MADDPADICAAAVKQKPIMYPEKRSDALSVFLFSPDLHYLFTFLRISIDFCSRLCYNTVNSSGVPEQKLTEV